TLAAKSSLSFRTTRQLAFRRARSRSRRPVRPNLRTSRGHSAAMSTTTAQARSPTNTQLTVVILTVGSSPLRERVRRGTRELRTVEDSQLQGRKLLALAGADPPGLLHVEARAVAGDHMRVHREDHVFTQLGLVALADPRVLDHRHPDRVPRDVAELEPTAQ